MPKQFLKQQRDRAVRMVVDHLDGVRRSVFAVSGDWAKGRNGGWSRCAVWVQQALAGGGESVGGTSKASSADSIG